MDIDFPADPFWDWSIVTYARPGVAPACLALQERHGLDVNLLLFCFWVAGRGQRLNREALQGIVQEVRAWHQEAVRPLRHVRQRLKGGIASAPAELAETVRKRVASVELDAEHLEQIMLSRRAEPPSPTDDLKATEDVAANLQTYAAVSDFDWTGEDMGALRTLLDATAPGRPPQRANELLAAICGGSGA